MDCVSEWLKTYNLIQTGISGHVVQNTKWIDKRENYKQIEYAVKYKSSHKIFSSLIGIATSKYISKKKNWKSINEYKSK